MNSIWLGGKTNVKTIRVNKELLIIELIHEDCSERNQQEAVYYLDVVKVPRIYINEDTFGVMYEQLITNDMKNVGYDYNENFCEVQEETFKTMNPLQIKGTLELLIKEKQSI